MRSIALLPSKATLYFTLGLLPFAADLVPKRVSLDITRPGVPYFAGALIIVLKLLAGAAGRCRGSLQPRRCIPDQRAL